MYRKARSAPKLCYVVAFFSAAALCFAASVPMWERSVYPPAEAVAWRDSDADAETTTPAVQGRQDGAPTTAATVGLKGKDESAMVSNHSAPTTSAESPTEAVAEAPTGNEIGYQGFLKQDGHPVNGLAEFKFYLFNAETGGSQVGSLVEETLNVVNGQCVLVMGVQSGPTSGC